MPGAIIALDQDRPGPTTSAGSPGISRNDLWIGQPIRPRCTTSGNGSFSWTLLGKPFGSTAVLSDDDEIACVVTADVSGSYRLQLVTNDGGPGNVQVLTFRVRYDAAGVLVARGWALPAVGESPGEANYPVPGGNNERGYDEPITFIIEDLLPFVRALPFPEELIFAAGRQAVGFASTLVLGSRTLDLSDYPATLSGKTRHVFFAATISSSQAAGVIGTVALFDQTASVFVGGATLDNSAAASRLNPTEVVSGELIVGAASGNVRSDTVHQYDVTLAMTTGSSPEMVICHNARLLILYY